MTKVVPQPTASGDTDIDWSDPGILHKLGLPPAEIKGVSVIDWSNLPRRLTCEICIKVRRNVSACCKMHPVTKQIDPRTQCCPQLDLKTGLCKVYGTADYPEECATYYCPEHVESTRGLVRLTVLR